MYYSCLPGYYCMLSRLLFVTAALLLAPDLAYTAHAAESEASASKETDQGGAGDLLITPTRIVLDNRTRSAEVTLNNRGPKEATFRISLVKMRMNNKGLYENVEEKGAPNPDEKFADDLIRFSPRQVVLKPAESQTVKIMLKKDAAGDGEYRTHMLMRAVPDTGEGQDIEAPAKLGENEIAVRLIPVYGISIPVIVRLGALEATGGIENVHVSGNAMTLTLTRRGTRSLFGDLTVTQGANEVVGILRGVAVFTPNTRREVTLPLTAPKGGLKSPLTVSWREREADGDALLAESKVNP